MNAIRKKRVYRGKLSYLVPDDSSIVPEVPSEESYKPPSSFTETQQSDTIYQTCNEADDDDQTCNEADDDDDDDCDTSSASVSGFVTCSEMLSDTNISNKVDKLTESRTQYTSIQQNSEETFSRPQADHLVPLSSPLPNTWITREDDFLNISFITIPFLSRTVIGDPELQVGSGKIRIVWIDGAATRMDAFKVFTGSETGKHIEMDQVKLIDAKAFRIEPITSGIMTVDGEVVPSGPIQGQVHPHMGFVMSRKRKSKLAGIS